ncbi:c-type cytochrome [Pantoea rwandensis]|uniref:Cytochrome c domain-containing protein n=1 Tax=Pantoea rwandensis TaxID=1076550 RepID=A0A1X1D3A1_9GAMM|nr:cytochrome c [Pantoea rwandensis]ORM71060.1 hypothetical protein HA51_03985 [Pantoea rwandensis]
MGSRYQYSQQAAWQTFPALAHNSAVLSDDPSSVISIIMRGGKMAVTKDDVTGLTMPDFGWRLDDKQLADLTTFIRNSWGNQAREVTADEVKKLRGMESTMKRKEPSKSNQPETGQTKP